MQAHNPLRQKEKAVMERLGIKSKKRLRKLYKKARMSERLNPSQPSSTPYLDYYGRREEIIQKQQNLREILGV